ncbi:phosphoenolpyruvate carboxylase [Patescibacteria group bacterium]|nr:phosphoenolpyruvate carboxylase [Patescibacteria group bacterium]
MFDPQTDRIIPKLMATQHPDNASAPFWGSGAFISTSEEVEEIYESFFRLGCDEYMWDWEGKFTDEAMIERLLSGHIEDLREKQLGRDRFVTLRIPNIWEEKSFKLARAYMSVLSACELTKSLELSTPPIFELILPMTKSADQLLHIQKTFKQTAKVHEEIFGTERFGSGYIHIVPLFESVEDLSGCSAVLEEFLKGHKEFFGFYPTYLRVFIARSDPAINAGFPAAVLACRLALRELGRLSEKYGLPIYPIVGTGSLPFRGGINPENIEKSLPQYQGVHTVTIQSAFRYDYPLEEVQEACNKIKLALENVEAPRFSDTEFFELSEIIDVFESFYRPTLESFAPFINEMAQFVPARRERALHVGLFGYSRGVGEIRLPRAITFTAACYSMGIPPEFIGVGRALRSLSESGRTDLVERHFFTLRHELSHAGKFLNLENLEFFARTESWAKEIMEDVRISESILGLSLAPQKDHHLLHRNLTSNIVVKQRLGDDFTDDLVEAAVMRKSLG